MTGTTHSSQAEVFRIRQVSQSMSMARTYRRAVTRIDRVCHRINCARFRRVGGGAGKDAGRMTYIPMSLRYGNVGQGAPAAVLRGRGRSQRRHPGGETPQDILWRALKLEGYRQL